MQDKIVIDRSTLKALVVDTRMNILKLLTDKKYTQTEIAALLGISKASAKEHLDILEQAELVKKEKTDRKWKYYELTFKGSFVAKPREIKVMFMFALNIVAVVGVAGYMLSKSMPQQAAPKLAAEMAVMAADTVQAAPVASTFPTWWVVLCVLGLSAGIMLGYLIKKRQIIIGGKT